MLKQSVLSGGGLVAVFDTKHESVAVIETPRTYARLRMLANGEVDIEVKRDGVTMSKYIVLGAEFVDTNEPTVPRLPQVSPEIPPHNPSPCAHEGDE